MAYDLFNTVLGQFDATLTAWQPDLLFYGTTILTGIAAGGGAIVATKAAIQAGNGSWTSMLFELLFGFFKIGLVYMVMDHVYDWGSAMFHIGTHIGRLVSGQSINTLPLRSTIMRHLESDVFVAL